METASKQELKNETMGIQVTEMVVKQIVVLLKQDGYVQEVVPRQQMSV